MINFHGDVSKLLATANKGPVGIELNNQDKPLQNFADVLNTQMLSEKTGTAQDHADMLSRQRENKSTADAIHQKSTETKNDEMRAVSAARSDEIRQLSQKQGSAGEKSVDSNPLEKKAAELQPQNTLEKLKRIINNQESTVKKTEPSKTKELDQLLELLKRMQALLNPAINPKAENPLINKGMEQIAPLISRFKKAMQEHAANGVQEPLKKVFQQIDALLKGLKKDLVVVSKKPGDRGMSLDSLLTEARKTLHAAQEAVSKNSKGVRQAESVPQHKERFVESNQSDNLKQVPVVNQTAIKRTEVNVGDRHDSSMGFQFLKQQGVGSLHRDQAPGAAGQRNPLFQDQLNDIIGQSKLYVRDSKNSSFSVNLYPENLGKINVNLGLEKGVLYGKFLVDNADSKQLLTENLSFIKDELANAGISVGGFQIDVRDNGARFLDQGQPQKRQHRYDYEIAPVNQYESNAVRHHDGAIDMVI